MPDQRRHRGPHPQDPELFGESSLTRLRHATSDLSWLLSRGYAIPSSLKLVGDRYALTARQRLAVSRSACSDDAAARRARHRVESVDLQLCELWIDGYNVLTSVEAALAGGVILHGQDSCFRDMASMHGSYRRVEETIPAIDQIGRHLESRGVQVSHWLLDRPVSNSGRLKQWLLERSTSHGWKWEVELVPDPDPILCVCPHLVASADSQILDKADQWTNLARDVIETQLPNSWVVNLSDRESDARGEGV